MVANRSTSWTDDTVPGNRRASHTRAGKCGHWALHLPPDPPPPPNARRATSCTRPARRVARPGVSLIRLPCAGAGRRERPSNRCAALARARARPNCRRSLRLGVAEETRPNLRPKGPLGKPRPYLTELFRSSPRDLVFGGQPHKVENPSSTSLLIRGRRFLSFSVEGKRHRNNILQIRSPTSKRARLERR